MVGAVVRETIALLDEMGLKASERELVLREVLRARLGSGARGANVPQPGAGAGSGNGWTPQQPLAPIVPDGSDPVLAAICSKLNISADTAELVYAVEDGQPQLVVSPKKISGNKSQQTRTIAKLVAAARQAAGIEEWTTAKTVREVVTTYGALDPSNFATTFGQLEDVAVIKGSGQERAIKITRPGYEAVGEAIKSFLGAPE